MQWQCSARRVSPCPLFPCLPLSLSFLFFSPPLPPLSFSLPPFFPQSQMLRERGKRHACLREESLCPAKCFHEERERCLISCLMEVLPQSCPKEQFSSHSPFSLNGLPHCCSLVHCFHWLQAWKNSLHVWGKTRHKSLKCLVGTCREGAGRCRHCLARHVSPCFQPPPKWMDGRKRYIWEKQGERREGRRRR